MAEETVAVVPEVPAVPEPPAPKTPDVSEPIIENRREAIESLVISQNEAPAVPEEKEVPKAETPVAKEESPDPIAKIKESVQKRIDKVVAQKKSAEEELAEARAEIERLKASKAPEVTAPKDDTPPTPEQVEAYIAKMSEEGNHKEVAAATRYLIKLEKELALKEIEERQTNQQKQAEAAKAKADAEMRTLANDYVAYNAKGEPDIKSDLTLANRNGLLFKTALSLYNDMELHKKFYDDPNPVQGFRRAVADAFKEIHQQGIITPKAESVIPRVPRMSLADPSAEVVEETGPSAPLSDADKVREEIIARKKNR